MKDIEVKIMELQDIIVEISRVIGADGFAEKYGYLMDRLECFMSMAEQARCGEENLCYGEIKMNEQDFLISMVELKVRLEEIRDIECPKECPKKTGSR